MCESMLGLYPIEAEIDKRKLMFFGKICNLGVNILSKRIFLYRIYDLIANEGKQVSGFVRDIWKILLKYDLINYLQIFLNEARFPTKGAWKTIVRQSIHNFQSIAWTTRTETDRDFKMFRNLHHNITPAKIYKFDFSFDEIRLIKFVAKLWTVTPLPSQQICALCEKTYHDPFQHAVLCCPATEHIRDTFFNCIVNEFDVHLYYEITHMCNYDLYLMLLGGFPTTVLNDQHDQKSFICICAKFLCEASAYFSKATALT